VAVVDTTQLHFSRTQLQAERESLVAKRPSLGARIGVLLEERRNLKRDLDRYRRLVKEGAVPSKQLEDIENRLGVIDKQIGSLETENPGIAGEISAKEARIAQLNDQIKKSVVRNPVDGVVLTRYAEKGELTSYGKPLYKIADLQTMFLRVYLSGAQVPQVKIGEEVDVLIAGVGKRFGAVQALQAVTLSVGEGELFGFIGADGAGKTTLFRILATLLLPDEGKAEVLGLDVVHSYRDIRKRIGYMPGKFSLYPDLSVEENLRFFASVFGTTVEKNYELIRDIYSQLEPFKTRRAGKLSGGMKQKLALSCALVHRPEVLFLDEPTTGVDAVSRKEFWQMLGRLREQGMTILVSTPYMDEAVLCDRIAFMQEGRMLALDTPTGITTLFRKPLFAIRASETWRLLCALRASPDAASVYAFGSALHYTDNRPAVRADELLAVLQAEGFTDVSVSVIQPGIEDTFIALVEEKQESVDE
jgi:ABC-type multidrug transport system ATPase subunit